MRTITIYPSEDTRAGNRISGSRLKVTRIVGKQLTPEEQRSRNQAAAATNPLPPTQEPRSVGVAPPRQDPLVSGPDVRSAQPVGTASPAVVVAGEGTRQGETQTSTTRMPPSPVSPTPPTATPASPPQPSAPDSRLGAHVAPGVPQRRNINTANPQPPGSPVPEGPRADPALHPAQQISENCWILDTHPAQFQLDVGDQLIIELD